MISILNSNKYKGYIDDLGEDQWNWLENTLDNNDIFTIIALGIQASPYDKLLSEALSIYSKFKWLRILNKKKMSGVFLVSGDIHYAEELKFNCSSSFLGYVLREITTSSLTHSLGEYIPFHKFMVRYINNSVSLVNNKHSYYSKNNFLILKLNINEENINQSTLTYELRNKVNKIIISDKLIRKNMIFNNDKDFDSNELEFVKCLKSIDYNDYKMYKGFLFLFLFILFIKKIIELFAIIFKKVLNLFK